MKSRVLALFLAAASAAYAADREFDRITGAIEHYYGVKRTHIPLMGVTNFFLKVAHPAGASGFKIAVFEDLPAPSDYRDQEDLDRFMNQISSEGLHALAVTHSRRDGEASYILAGEIGKATRLLIATFGRREATVIEVEVNMDTLLRVIGSPGEAHRMIRQDGDDGR